MRLGHRFEAARRDVLRGGRDRVDRIDVALGQHVGEDQPDRENRKRDRQQVDAMLLQRAGEIGEVGHHLDVTEKVVLDLDRDQVDSLLAGRADRESRHGERVAAVLRGSHCHGVDRAAVDRFADQRRIGAVDDQVLARRDRNFEPVVVQRVDVVLQAIAVEGADRGQLLHAYLDGAGEFLDIVLGRFDDPILRVEADHHFGAERQPQQHHHQCHQLGFEIECGKSDSHGNFQARRQMQRPPSKARASRPACPRGGDRLALGSFASAREHQHPHRIDAQ